MEIKFDVGKKYGLRQVILCAWDGELTHVVTWGKSVDDCSKAADGGNMIKEKIGFPSFNDQPSRVRKLEKELAELRKYLSERNEVNYEKGIWRR